jgi:predicted Zn-dependent protease
MRSVNDLSVASNKAKSGWTPVTMTPAILMGIAGAMMGAVPARAVQIDQTEIELTVF